MKFAVAFRQTAFQIQHAFARPHADPHLLLAERLDQESVGACLHALDKIGLFAPGRAEDEVGIVIGRLRPEPAAKLRSGQSGHQPVADYQADRLAAKNFESLFPVCRFDDIVAPFAEKQSGYGAHGRVVVDQQNFCRHGQAGGRAGGKA